MPRWTLLLHRGSLLAVSWGISCCSKTVRGTPHFDAPLLTGCICKPPPTGECVGPAKRPSRYGVRSGTDDERHRVRDADNRAPSPSRAPEVGSQHLRGVPQDQGQRSLCVCRWAPMGAPGLCRGTLFSRSCPNLDGSILDSTDVLLLKALAAWPRKRRMRREARTPAEGLRALSAILLSGLRCSPWHSDLASQGPNS
jgi:hypothetical protein